jgi:hypothetical protein
MSQETDEDEQCRLITEVALRRAMDECGSAEAVREQVRRVIGLDGDLDPDCETALEEGLDMSTLANTRQTRQWVFCRAWELIDTENIALSNAVEKAWAEARAAGQENNIEV